MPRRKRVWFFSLVKGVDPTETLLTSVSLTGRGMYTESRRLRQVLVQQVTGRGRRCREISLDYRRGPTGLGHRCSTAPLCCSVPTAWRSTTRSRIAQSIPFPRHRGHIHCCRTGWNIAQEGPLAWYQPLTVRMEAFKEHRTGSIEGNAATIVAMSWVCWPPSPRDNAGPPLSMPEKRCFVNVTRT